ncbi:MAG: ATP synthase F1 subunit delta [Deltaproteobacteria bacterium]|nr:ATP synthase F1 subunit delta [Deltaproteobacteria bacterium]MBN2672948.1 ATP synthase F1 subunit delta [Deltaproteobacteria bacterium]
MVTGSIARRWAKALFLLAEQENMLLAVTKEVDRVADAWNSSDELQAAMSNPMLDSKVRTSIFMEVVDKLAVSKTTRNFFSLLNEKKRVSEISAISRELQMLADKKENRIRAEVVSAAPVNETVVASIKAAIEASTRKTVVVSKRVDESLIGGIVTRVGDLVYDGSIRTQLNRIKEDMLNG